MMNETQQSVLSDLIESAVHVIINDRSMDIGTKVLYLSKSINQDCQTYLMSLDKLYQENNIELIRAFKRMNDLRFDNESHDSTFGNRHMLRNCLGGIGCIKRAASLNDPYQEGEEVELEECKIAVARLINEKMREIFTREHDATLQQQMSSRLLEENIILPQPAWRLILDLPQNQLTLEQRNRPVQQPFHFFQPAPVDAIQELANNTGISVVDLNQYFDLGPEYRNHILKLQIYLENNYRRNGLPSLTPDEAFVLTREDSKKLNTAYPFIKAGLLTINQAKAFSWEEYDILAAAGNNPNQRSMEDTWSFLQATSGSFQGLGRNR